ncbi:STAS domain-containing protein [Actinotalea sp. JY-7885]|uniref:STAS domain-containing protein n=1 Tax=Actinotalea sp. JY-7885 TaxID=2758576 RepID=UPI00165E5D0A|nr:STAS domain-containing protein [Actinotalea sp. JY-7885]
MTTTSQDRGTAVTGPDEVVAPAAPGSWGGIELGTAPDGTSVVHLWGDVDAGLREEASVVMAQVVLRAGPVVVDAADVTFLDSTGLAFVLQLVRAGEEEGRTVVVLDPPDGVSDLIELAGMTDLIPVRRTTAPD